VWDPYRGGNKEGKGSTRVTLLETQKKERKVGGLREICYTLRTATKLQLTGVLGKKLLSGETSVHGKKPAIYGSLEDARVLVKGPGEIDLDGKIEGK